MLSLALACRRCSLIVLRIRKKSKFIGNTRQFRPEHRSGNTDSTLINTNYRGSASKKTSPKRNWRPATTTASDGENNTDNWLLGANYQRSIREHFYWLINTDYKVDKIAGLDYRFNLGPGLGYRVWESDKGNVDLEAGFGFQ